jgi:hypothetical protein
MRIIECGYCGFKGLEEVFKYGKGREYGQHPEHRYCPCCGQSIDWFGHKILWIGGSYDGSGIKDSALVR